MMLHGPVQSWQCVPIVVLLTISHRLTDAAALFMHHIRYLFPDCQQAVLEISLA